MVRSRAQGRARACPAGPVPIHPGHHPVVDKVRQLQRRLWVAAKRSPERRFHALMDRIWRGDVLQEAWRRVKTEPRRGGCRCETLAARRAIRCGAHASRARGCVARRHVSSAAGPAAIHPEGRWPTAAARHSHGPRPSRANGRDARAHAHLRGGFSRLVVWVSAEAERDAGTGDAARAWCARWQPCPGRRHSRLLRQHRPAAVARRWWLDASRTDGC